jgi:hypothetical protein
MPSLSKTAWILLLLVIAAAVGVGIWGWRNEWQFSSPVPKTIHEKKVAAFITAAAADPSTVQFLRFGPNISGEELIAAAKKREEKLAKEKKEPGGWGFGLGAAGGVGGGMKLFENLFLANQFQAHTAFVRVRYKADGQLADMIFLVLDNQVLPWVSASDDWKPKMLKAIESGESLADVKP